MRYRDQWLLYGLIVLGLLSALPGLVARIGAEGSVRNVELVADQKGFTQIAQQVGVTPRIFLGQLHQIGVQGLGVSESSISSLQGDGLVAVLNGAAWLGQRDAVGAGPLPFPVSPYGTYVLIPDPTIASFVTQSLQSLLSGQRINYTIEQLNGETVIAIPIPADAVVLESLPLGFRPGAFDLARTLGMDVVPRLANTPWGLSATQVEALFTRIAGAGVPIHSIVFGGADTGVTGYPSNLAVTASLMRQHGYLLGAIENGSQLSNLNQPGITYLDSALGASTFRVYSVPDWLINTQSANRALTSLLSGVVERNLRMVYLHPITVGTDLVPINVNFYEQFVAQLRTHDIPLGTPQGFPVVNVHTYARVLENLGVVAGGLLLLEALFPGIRRYGYQPLAVLGVLAIGLSLVSHTTSVLVGALGAAVAFGGLATVWLARTWSRWEWPERLPSFGQFWIRGFVASLTMAGITFVGALFIGTLLGSTSFFLEWHYFRGVKLTFLAIPLVALLAFMAYVGFSPQGRSRVRSIWGELRWLGDQSLTYKYVGAIAVVIAIGGYYLLRSGNVSSHLVPGLEVAERDFLANLFTYRPLEKEFLVGYPAIFLAMIFAARRSRAIFLFWLLGASVGMVSIIDAFATLRTPFINTLLRESYGLLTGLITASVALALFYIWFRLFDRRWTATDGAETASLPDRD